MKNILLAALVLLNSSCVQKQKKEMDNKDKFSWGLSVVAADRITAEELKGWGYTVTTYTDGYLASDTGFITGIAQMAGSIGGGWDPIYPQAGAMDQAGGGDGVPSKLFLTWVSYAEKKCWTINAKLPKDTMLAMFRKGVMDNMAGRHGESGFRHMDYDHIEIGLAPGGVVVLWLMGGWHRTEVCRLQAQESGMDPRDFIGSTGKRYASPKNFMMILTVLHGNHQTWHPLWYLGQLPATVQLAVQGAVL